MSETLHSFSFLFFLILPFLQYKALTLDPALLFLHISRKLTYLELLLFSLVSMGKTFALSGLQLPHV